MVKHESGLSCEWIYHLYDAVISMAFIAALLNKKTSYHPALVVIRLLII